MKHKNTKAMILLLLSCTLIVSVFFVSRKKPQNIAVNQTIAVTKHSSSDETATEAATDKEEPSVEPASKKVVGGRTYIDGILIVNKHYSLPSDYNPGVDQTADAAIQKMIAAAHKDGITLWVRSGFRSYDIQTSLYNTYVAEDGKSAASRYSARPGHSEHQTGLAFDLNSLDHGRKMDCKKLLEIRLHHPLSKSQRRRDRIHVRTMARQIPWKRGCQKGDGKRAVPGRISEDWIMWLLLNCRKIYDSSPHLERNSKRSTTGLKHTSNQLWTFYSERRRRDSNPRASFPANAFRVRLVMTTSIRLHIDAACDTILL